MGSSDSVLEKKSLNMKLHYFALFLLLVLTVNGAPKPDPKASPKAAPKPIPKAAPKPNPKAAPKPNPKPHPKPNPKADPKAKAQMAIIINNKKHGGDMGMPKMENRESEYIYGYGDDYNDEVYVDYTGDYAGDDYAGYANGDGTDYNI